MAHRQEVRRVAKTVLSKDDRFSDGHTEEDVELIDVLVSDEFFSVTCYLLHTARLYDDQSRHMREAERSLEAAAYKQYRRICEQYWDEAERGVV